MLELYQFEHCGFCRRVREKLCDLGVDYIARVVDPEERERVIRISGQPLVPVLVDPQRKAVVAGSAKICAYLDEHYG